jgi:GntR family transcriptional regulator/MocR family aminotransferase
VAIVEDDYDSEFHHGARPADTLWALDGGGRVFFVGTFSKSLSPAIRIGYVVAPRPLADALAAARFVSDRNPPLHTQAALARFLDEGQFARHLRRMRGEYRARHEELLGALKGQRGLRAQPVAVGLHVVARAPDDLDDLAVSHTLRSVDVAVYPLSGFFAGPPTSKGFVLAFGAIARPDIRPGVARLLAALDP